MSHARQGRLDAPIETERLALEAWAHADEAMLLAMMRDDGVRRFLLDGAWVEPVWVRAEIDASAARFGAGSLGLFVARLKAEGNVVGFAGFRPDHDPPVLELIYGLLPPFWRRGLATELGRAMLNLAFDRGGHAVVRAAVDEPNVDSLRVLRKLGLVEVGRSPGAFGPMLHFALAGADRLP